MCGTRVSWDLRGVYAAQPREGTETFLKFNSDFVHEVDQGLCSSTPRGDGNHQTVELVGRSSAIRVYAAQPREGTETFIGKILIRYTINLVYAAQPREGTETSV